MVFLGKKEGNYRKWVKRNCYIHLNSCNSVLDNYCIEVLHRMSWKQNPKTLIENFTRSDRMSITDKNNTLNGH